MFNEYSLKARLWPALLAGLPAAGVIAVVVPGLQWWYAGGIGATAAAGFTFLLSQMARAAGKRKEPGLYAGWGGKPTTCCLCHHGSPLDRHTVGRYHRNIERIAPELKMPTADEEIADPTAAHAKYDAATRILIHRTRDTKRFRRLFEENIHYGFCRNVWGLKAAAVTVAALAASVCSLLVYREVREGSLPPMRPIVVGVLSVLWAILWLAWFRAAWVKVAANSYAEWLLEASEDLVKDLPGEPATASRRKPKTTSPT
jgi:hypothetical protein